MNPKIIEEVPMSLYDLKKEVTKIKKRDEELSLSTGKTEEYLNNFLILKQSDAESLENAIRKLNIPRLKEDQIKKIVDLAPLSVDELKIVLQGYTLTVSKENMAKIIDEVKKIRKE